MHVSKVAATDKAQDTNYAAFIARVKKNDDRKSTLMKLGMIMDQALSAIFYMTSSNRKGGVSFG